MALVKVSSFRLSQAKIVFCLIDSGERFLIHLAQVKGICVRLAQVKGSFVHLADMKGSNVRLT